MSKLTCSRKHMKICQQRSKQSKNFSVKKLTPYQLRKGKHVTGLTFWRGKIVKWRTSQGRMHKNLRSDLKKMTIWFLCLKILSTRFNSTKKKRNKYSISRKRARRRLKSQTWRETGYCLKSSNICSGLCGWKINSRGRQLIGKWGMREWLSHWGRSIKLLMSRRRTR